jgi:hypothetical protein
MERIIIPIKTAVIVVCCSFTLGAQSPYRISWEKDGYILGAGGTATAAGYFLYRSVPAPVPQEIYRLDRGGVVSPDRGATYKYSENADKNSDILYAAAAVSPLLLLADRRIEEEVFTVALMYAEVWSLIGGTSMLSKWGIVRYRPFAYNPDAPWSKKLESDAKMSFFSNHAATAFASAVFISTVYGDYRPESGLRLYISVISLLAAGYTSYLRYEAGMHFPTDIAAGIIIGSAAGYIIPCMHRTGEDKISFLPYSRDKQHGIAIQIKF